MNSKDQDLNLVKQPCAALPRKRREGLSAAWLITRAWLVFAVFWVIFDVIFQAFPYLSSGSEVIYRSKLNQETNGSIFPESSNARRVLVFGDSEILVGFIPEYFDSLAAADGLNYYSYNSGYPARGFFVSQLETMVQRKSGVPNILLLTVPWRPKQESFNLFHPLQADHDIADRLFPFRYLIRDTFSFLITSQGHGGPAKYYRESRLNDAKMLQDRGYYFISEQSHYPNDALPEDFHLASDQPNAVVMRTADGDSEELKELNRIIEEHNVQCYFVPAYTRVGQLGTPPKSDQAFADFLHHHSLCKVLGPDYVLYPNRMFSDAAHLNREGAKVYTKDIYELLAQEVIDNKNAF